MQWLLDRSKIYPVKNKVSLEKKNAAKHLNLRRPTWKNCEKILRRNETTHNSYENKWTRTGKGSQKFEDHHFYRKVVTSPIGAVLQRNVIVVHSVLEDGEEEFKEERN